MLRVGLTGGLATGKTFVGEALRGLGCLVIRADELGHRTLQPDGEAYASVLREFGETILQPDRTIDRARLAALVFDHPERLNRLNALVHPCVLRQEEALIAEFAAREPDGIAVVEAAILIEAGSAGRFDQIVLTVCREEQQIERALAREGWTREQALARLRRQMPLEEKRRYAQHVVDTSGSKEETLRQVQEIYRKLRSMAL